ncbi:MAG: acyl carrier protein [Patescibacteria group bacterium]
MSKLTTIFSSVLGIDESAVIDTLAPSNAPSWDSLNAIILLTEIEKAFDVTFGMDEAMAVKNFADVKALVASKEKDPNA